MNAFASLVGQAHLKRTLTRAHARGQLAHAYLFHGEDGLGMECAALETARLVLCDGAGEAPCGDCTGCAQTRRLDHPDLRIVFPLPAAPAGKEEQDPAELYADQVLEELARLRETAYEPVQVPGARQILVGQARHLKRWASLKSYQGAYRVALILQAEKMGLQAQNAILKLLEEPPEQMLLILCSGHPDRLLPTILSRCQRLRFAPVNEEELAAWFAARPGAEAGAAGGLPAPGELARLSGGNPGRGLELLSEFEREASRPGKTGDGEVPKPTGALEFLRDLVVEDPGPLYRRITSLEATRDRPLLTRLLVDIADWLQDAELTGRLPEEAAGLVRNLHQLEALRKFSASYRVRDMRRAAEILQQGQRLAERNVHPLLLLTTVAQRLRTQIERKARAG